MSERESMEYDVVIVGAGPAGLSAAIRLKQLAEKAGQEISVCILEKGSEVGAHILSGAIIDPIALDELIPDWRERGAPLTVQVTESPHWILTPKKHIPLPSAFLPPFMHNKGFYTGSLGSLCRWLAEEAENLGVEIFPGFAAADVIYDEKGKVKGILTGDKGVGRDGKPRDDFEPGIELHGRYTFFAEGARGHLTRRVIQQFQLDAECQPQVYGLGLKELWEVSPDKHIAGRVVHTQGWPLLTEVGGGFIYHQEKNQVAIGFVVGLGYSNPYLSPFKEFQRWKEHPSIRPLLEGGRRISYGARVINEGGYQAIPKLIFPGGALIGCSAGFVNVPRIKGTHGAMKSAMLAAEAAFDALTKETSPSLLTAYPESFEKSWLAVELKKVRNAEPAIAHFGPLIGSGIAGTDMWMRNFGIDLPFTLGHRPDNTTLVKKEKGKKQHYPKPDGKVSFDRPSSVYLANTQHDENEPCHLTLKDPTVPIDVNLALYDSPERCYCPAGVYEILGVEENKPRLQINAQNCIHCKSCDIKDPTGNIVWVAPQGGDGPNYPNM
ncbi:MAG: electron transfer flavoprotein-ubiquinone oxidoreductase [Zymomonas mobilis subsp. pomaceae]|uniref:Electron transfer flavoprotein-ubiquinone oxidoreductase n=1 Tax=Zymomonas mobilis subsp. pomaceae (strain ATCC 29192 / DSM 22645 / JCM 10191 / CCUG 17912 / NBRC 13757 / NCIMB 11200 / NRRL B-4491 / Barker I) TaxID=579138 RepID=F8ETL1_ZYMMT|nr:electron transfer flavoprotein-ubiquinone oxidoreductase [Zymomonas mobilis]AEI37021.1 Electron-transferring-flavoprotein dehydrogenase [Zymomonas mobilis subsp. pomaceae ATCC 29192]MDX5948393.1 electron transfer flavoprotein-ubiquinone oxidoreductase [Zymomonas mobilis subsp. pomaceae]GEB89617.1 electron transfer flavoprotein-ubiquinone oxidoreductase [Zymomonas mobilis subsp. pomaceae]